VRVCVCAGLIHQPTRDDKKKNAKEGALGSHLHSELSCLDRRNISAWATANHDQVVLGSGGEPAGWAKHRAQGDEVS
jgi:hypothetical protein